MAEKTEKPTEKKLNDSAKKGQTFKGKDLIAAAVLVCGCSAVSSQSSLFPMGELLQKIILNPDNVKLVPYINELGIIFLHAFLPVFFAALLPIIILSLLQSRFRLAIEAIRINFSVLNPISGLKKIFSLRTVKDFFKAIFYFFVFITATIFYFFSFGKEIFSLIGYHFGYALSTKWSELSLYFVFYFLGFSILLLILDTFFEFFLYIKELKMEKHEVKKEYKENEGDPQLKGERKQIHRELLSEEIKTNVKKSQFVLANPTHIAIAIFFDPDVADLPFISVKCSNAKALAVISYAEENDIPIVRDISLARKIYKNNEMYSFIRDVDLFEIMKILIWLQQVELEKYGISMEDVAKFSSSQQESSKADEKLNNL